jgi:hypothetical protein
LWHYREGLLEGTQALASSPGSTIVIYLKWTTFSSNEQDFLLLFSTVQQDLSFHIEHGLLFEIFVQKYFSVRLLKVVVVFL